MKNTYDVGDLVELTATFTDPDSGAPVDPETVTCAAATGEKETVELEVTKSAAGVYKATVPITCSGEWHYAFDGTGGYQASAEGGFSVLHQTVPR